MDKNEFLNEYRTGDVVPPKSRRWLITALLLTIIFLSSLISALGFANIHLFRILWGEDAGTTVRFVDDVRLTPPDDTAEEYTDIEGLGIRGRFLTEFDQRYFDLPQGIYISAASTMVPDLYPGDVLLKINGREVTNQDVLDALVDSHAHGATLSLEIYRNGNYQTISAILNKDVEEN